MARAQASLLAHDRIERAKELAIRAWRIGARTFGMRSIDQRREIRFVRAWLDGAQSVERAGLVQQSLSPCFDGMQSRPVGVGGVGPLRHPGADRLRVHITHQAPNVLELAASSTPLTDALRMLNRFEKVLGKLELLEPRRR